MQNWWLITWTTYATWLPGDPRGFQTWKGKEYIPQPKRYARAGESTYNPDNFTNRRLEAERTSGKSVRLSLDHCHIAVDAVVRAVSEIPLEPAILAVGETHTHFLARFGGLGIRRTIGRLKAKATQRLHEAGLASNRIWSRNCHMKSKAPGREFENVFDYVLRHQAEGAVVYVWDEFQASGRGSDDKSSAWVKSRHGENKN